MPSKDTFSIKPIRSLISKYIFIGLWIDPFARNSPFKHLCKFTNDLDPAFRCSHNLESLDFLKQFDDNSIDGVLFDPPYSSRQIQECYNNIGRQVHMEDTQGSFYGERKKEISRIVKPDGVVISCGWNSGGIGMKNNFKMIEILLVPHGGAHYDTIITVENKIQKKKAREQASIFECFDAK